MSETQTIHHILAKSYFMYFLASIIGLFIDVFIDVRFGAPFAIPVAIIFLGLGPLLMLWAQYTSWQSHRGDATTPYFHRGPYRLVRNPTHLGILLLVTGYTLISGSVVFFGMTLIGFLVSNIFFSKYERLAHASFGDEYHAYKSRTPKI